MNSVARATLARTTLTLDNVQLRLRILREQRERAVVLLRRDVHIDNETIIELINRREKRTIENTKEFKPVPREYYTEGVRCVCVVSPCDYTVQRCSTVEWNRRACINNIRFRFAARDDHAERQVVYCSIGVQVVCYSRCSTDAHVCKEQNNSALQLQALLAENEALHQTNAQLTSQERGASRVVRNLRILQFERRFIVNMRWTVIGRNSS
jgi:hypothetical protein